MKPLKPLKNIKLSRPSDKGIYHALEYMDAAFIELAFAVNLLTKHLKKQNVNRRKHDK